MVQLKESFAEQGVKVEAIEVTVQTHSFEQNLEQGRGNQSDQESGAGVSRRRTRRINLNTAFVEDRSGYNVGERQYGGFYRIINNERRKRKWHWLHPWKTVRS